MSIFDDDGDKPVPGHQVGQDLSLLSVEELRERVDQLKREIVRLEQELASKGATKDAAEALFRRG
ncbi:DUF1192 domain-containing protein [Nitratireductor sp. ZSWI3]|uniref:DUF1192 domain-containing protein n=1 Tax=Nitratireductor sp. ZSWI3 TaxID=2966359 RepID=UPI00215056A4|nr:DUF1192 domain-containing protein [Nitratireductor sp. ZSWI3]MCR4268018.1 DUF1192 domain-containing protein [Nitratireductor sp. ZSWI3]